MVEIGFDSVIFDLYSAFSSYSNPLPSSFCSHCYSEDDIARFCSTKKNELNSQLGRRLIWDLGHHNGSVIKYFLPRLMELIAPPFSINELYTGQIFRDLELHNFLQWSEQERKLVLQFFDILEQQKLAKIEDEIQQYTGKNLSYSEAKDQFEIPVWIDDEKWEKWRDALQKFRDKNA